MFGVRSTQTQVKIYNVKIQITKLPRVEIHPGLNSGILIFNWQFSTKKNAIRKKTEIVELGEYQPKVLKLILVLNN